jgi:hypothetical protein
MARLPDGSHRCPRCLLAFPAAEMDADGNYCKPCRRANARDAYARRQGGLKRSSKYVMPADFQERAGRISDNTLAQLYGVSDKTVRKWREELGIAPKRRTPEDSRRWGAMGNTVLRARFPERATGAERARRAVAVREARRANLDAALDSSGRIIPTSNGSVLAEAGISRDLMRMAMQAMAQAGSRVTEEDYA